MKSRNYGSLFRRVERIQTFPDFVKSTIFNPSHEDRAECIKKEFRL